MKNQTKLRAWRTLSERKRKPWRKRLRVSLKPASSDLFLSLIMWESVLSVSAALWNRVRSVQGGQRRHMLPCSLRRKQRLTLPSALPKIYPLVRLKNCTVAITSRSILSCKHTTPVLCQSLPTTQDTRRRTPQWPMMTSQCFVMKLRSSVSPWSPIQLLWSASHRRLQPTSRRLAKSNWIGMSSLRFWSQSPLLLTRTLQWSSNS